MPFTFSSHQKLEAVALQMERRILKMMGARSKAPFSSSVEMAEAFDVLQLSKSGLEEA